MDTQVPAGELPAHGPAISTGNGTHPPRRPSRSEMRDRRRKERESGVPFHLDYDDIDVQVKVLSVLERATLIGLPTEVQTVLLRAFNGEDVVPDAGKRTLDDMLSIMGIEEDMANEVCMAGFVWPRLVRTEGEADVANSPDVWWVQDIHLDDRKKYLNLVMGRDAAEMARINRFLRNGVAGVEDPHANGTGGTATSTVSALEYVHGIQPAGVSGF
jgi:hypothetical protein